MFIVIINWSITVFFFLQTTQEVLLGLSFSHAMYLFTVVCSFSACQQEMMMMKDKKKKNSLFFAGSITMHRDLENGCEALSTIDPCTSSSSRISCHNFVSICPSLYLTFGNSVDGLLPLLIFRNLFQVISQSIQKVKLNTGVKSWYAA